MNASESEKNCTLPGGLSLPAPEWKLKCGCIVPSLAIRPSLAQWLFSLAQRRGPALFESRAISLRWSNLVAKLRGVPRCFHALRVEISS